MKGNPLFSKLPSRFHWTAHNVIAHPVSEIVWQVGFSRSKRKGSRSRLIGLSNWVHDWTTPAHETGEGRG